MAKKEVFNIEINEITESHETVLMACNKMVNYYLEHPNTEIVLNFSNCSFIYPDYALLLLCSLKHLDNLGIEISGRIIYKQSNVISYLSRMNFFRYLKVKIPEKYARLPSRRFVEIQNYNSENQLDVLKSILKVIKNNSCINDNVYASLDYCLNEVLDNVLNHSEIKEGWVVAQYFERLNSIRLIVGDIGIGIQKSLNKRYNYSEAQAIKNCIAEGVTNGLGQGHGLYATSTFVKMNKGWLSLISGSKKLDVSEKQTKVSETPYWQGTCVYLRVNTNVDVDYKKFTSNNYDYKEQIFEDMFK